MRTQDATHTLWVNTYGIRFKHTHHYKQAVRMLLPYTRGSRYNYRGMR